MLRMMRRLAILREESIEMMALSGASPGPRTFWPLGFTKPFARDPIAMLEGLHREYGDIARVRIFIWHLHLAAHPDYVKHVLQENYQNYHESIVYQFLKPVVGEGLLTSEDDFWKRQRRIAAPAFHRKVLAGLATGMTEETESMLERWHGVAKRGEPIDALSEFMALTLEIVSRTMLSTDVVAETATVRESVTVLRDHVNYRMMRIVSLPERVPTPRNRRFARALDGVDRIVYGMIEDRRAGRVVAEDLLSMLMETRDEETGEGMSDKQLRDEVMTIFLAGHETTATSLSWTLYLLSQHPNAEQKLSDEVTARSVGGRRGSRTCRNFPTREWLSRNRSGFTLWHGRLDAKRSPKTRSAAIASPPTLASL